MTEWVFVLVPFLVLPIVVLFRFVGCAWIAGLEEGSPPEKTGQTTPPPPPPSSPPSPPPQQPPLTPVYTNPPNYQKYILGESGNPGLVKNSSVQPNSADVIAYWRLVDAAASTVAKDMKAFQDGLYVEGAVLPAINPTPTVPGSEGRNPGHFVPGEDSLINSDKAQKCRYFDGGYVRVPYKPGLYTDEFTIEAWIRTDTLALGFEHTLFDAGGRYAAPAGTPVAERGFRIFANRDRSWQMRLGSTKTDLFPAPPFVPLGARTHIAVTLQNDGPAGVQKKITLYVDGKATGSVTVPSYAAPHDAPLLIGVENMTNQPTAGENLRTPLLCRVQEVVLHRKALSKEEIENHVDINRSGPFL
jgi:hypothetical protein